MAVARPVRPDPWGQRMARHAGLRHAQSIADTTRSHGRDGRILRGPGPSSDGVACGNQGGIAIGPWLTPFLIALSGLGWLAGPVGFAVACRLSLALPGGLLAALALGRGAKAAPDGRGTGLRLAALAMLVYAPAAALIAAARGGFSRCLFGPGDFSSRPGSARPGSPRPMRYS